MGRSDTGSGRLWEWNGSWALVRHIISQLSIVSLITFLVRATLKEFSTGVNSTSAASVVDDSIIAEDDTSATIDYLDPTDELNDTLSQSSIAHYVMLENRRALIGVSKRLTRGM